MAKTIYESQFINYETGEIISKTSVKVKEFSEKFKMCRTTEGLSWLMPLTGEEIKTLLFLLEFEKDYKTPFTSEIRKELCLFLDISDRKLLMVIKSLEQKKFLIKLSRTDLLLNPIGFYKGSSKDVGARIRMFNEKIEETVVTSEEVKI